MNQSYGRLVSRAAIAATVMASSLLLIKIFAWWYTGSVSILAALVDSLMDIAASLTNLLVVRYSLQPADEEQLEEQAQEAGQEEFEGAGAHGDFFGRNTLSTPAFPTCS